MGGTTPGGRIVAGEAAEWPAHPTAKAAHAVDAGTWGAAEEVPGTAGLNSGGIAELFALSCASAGN